MAVLRPSSSVMINVRFWVIFDKAPRHIHSEFSNKPYFTTEKDLTVLRWQFQSKINNIINTHHPLRHFKLHLTDKPWFTADIKEGIANRQRALVNGNPTLFKFYRESHQALQVGSPKFFITIVLWTPSTVILRNGRIALNNYPANQSLHRSQRWLSTVPQ